VVFVCLSALPSLATESTEVSIVDVLTADQPVAGRNLLLQIGIVCRGGAERDGASLESPGNGSARWPLTFNYQDSLGVQYYRCRIPADAVKRGGLPLRASVVTQGDGRRAESGTITVPVRAAVRMLTYPPEVSAFSLGVRAEIDCDSPVIRADLYYRRQGKAEHDICPMNRAGAAVYIANVPDDRRFGPIASYFVVCHTKDWEQFLGPEVILTSGQNKVLVRFRVTGLNGGSLPAIDVEHDGVVQTMAAGDQHIEASFPVSNPSGTLRFSAVAKDYDPAWISVDYYLGRSMYEVEQPVQLSPQEHEVQVTVMDAEHAPIAAADVTVRGQNIQVSETTGEDGTCLVRLRLLPNTPLDVSADALGYQPRQTATVIQPTGVSKAVLFLLAAEEARRTLMLRIVTDSGEPVRDAAVSWGKKKIGTTDSDGYVSWTLKATDGDRLDLRIARPGKPALTEEVVIPRAADTELVVEVTE